MNNEPIIENGIIAGNVYPKYDTRNPIARVLTDGYLKALDRLVDFIAPTSIHEIGCGEGYLISRFANGKRTLAGSDFSIQVIQKARSLWGSLDISFHVGSVYELTPQKDSAQLVLCCEVMEHLESPERALDKLVGIADPYLITSVPREPLWRMLNILRGKYLTQLGNTPGHLQHWSKSAFSRLLETRFDVLRVETPLPWTMVLCRLRRK